MKCKQELCPNWSGDGRVCPCAVLDVEPPEGEETPYLLAWTRDGGAVWSDDDLP